MRDLKRQMSRFPAQKSMLSKQAAPLSGGFHQGTCLIHLLWQSHSGGVFSGVFFFGMHQNLKGPDELICLKTED